jgi:hypothetical protein
MQRSIRAMTAAGVLGVCLLGSTGVAAAQGASECGPVAGPGTAQLAQTFQPLGELARIVAHAGLTNDVTLAELCLTP